MIALAPAALSGGTLELAAHRVRPGAARRVTVEAHGRDPSGAPRILATLPLDFAAGETRATGALNLPGELRARVTRFEIAGQEHAGAVTLGDDGLRRREVALIAGRENREGLELLSPLHYLEQALVPTADILDGALMDVLPANPDVIVLADVATLSEAERAALLEWTEAGGLLLRFAGPRLAASDVSRREEAPLMPVRLRAGGRTVGGAMSWGEPKALAPFPEGSPFNGLSIPGEVRVSAQVMAQPDPTLADARDRAALRRHAAGHAQGHRGGAGRALPRHGQRRMVHAAAVGAFRADAGAAGGLLGGGAADAGGSGGHHLAAGAGARRAGRLGDAGTLPGVTARGWSRRRSGRICAPGSTRARPAPGAQRDRGRAELRPRPGPPGARRGAGPAVRDAARRLAAGPGAGAADGRRGGHAGAFGAALPGPRPRRCWPACWPAAGPGAAQEGDEAMRARTSEVVLAHVLTGNGEVDDTARAGLAGLSARSTFRTSVEPADPIGVNLETDELAFYPLLYWPVTPDQPIPSPRPMRGSTNTCAPGGMILFDTRDADVAGFGAASPNGAKLQRLARPLDIPPLEPVPDDHVLTRTFYLLQDFPGAMPGAVWVEAAPPDAEASRACPSAISTTTSRRW